jgi:hypothetical protein
MRAVVSEPNMFVGNVDISKITFDPKSRDDIPQILKGLQHIYITPSIRKEVFKLLKKHILPEIDKNNGRPGMDLWKIFVIGVLRLDLNFDYDLLHNIINNHKQIRQMLGHPDFYDDYYYHLQTMKDNVNLLTPELLDEINQVIVKAGHVILKKKDDAQLHGRCDSFVVETDVHFPTDINLLFDALRKVITLTGRLSERYEISSWRQYQYNIRHVKKLMRQAQQKKRVRARNEAGKAKCEEAIVQAHRDYVEVAQRYLTKASFTLEILEKEGLNALSDVLMIDNIKSFINHGLRQINQIVRRVIQGEKIAHEEKVFSLFEPHTEWINKGKAGVFVELGIKVCVIEDEHQFILHHKVMEKKTDEQIAISITKGAQKRFRNFNSCSYDKGFHSPKNQKELNKLLENVVLPRKGKLSKEAKEIEASEKFRKARKKHPAVESAINALEIHGLDRCPDHGIIGFKCYVALAVVGRNIQRLGAILRQKEQNQLERKKRKIQRLKYQENILDLAA